MYEGKIVRPEEENAVGAFAFGADGLRLVSWGELVARFDAARDFRRISAYRLQPGAGSFNCASARHLAALGEGKPHINPIALANGKRADGMDSAVTSDQMSGDRGR